MQANVLNKYQINFQKRIKNFNIKLLDKVELLNNAKAVSIKTIVEKEKIEYGIILLI